MKKRKFAALFLTVLIIISTLSAAPSFAATPTVDSTTHDIQVSVNDCDSGSVNTEASITYPNSGLTFSNGSSASYTFTVPKAGLYNLLVTNRREGNTASAFTLTATVGDVTKTLSKTADDPVDSKVGLFDLPAGEITMKIETALTGSNKVQLGYLKLDYMSVELSPDTTTNIYALDYIEADVSLEAPNLQPTNYASYNWNKKGCLDFSKTTEQYVTYSVFTESQGYYFLTGMLGRKDTTIDVYVNDTLIHNDVAYKHPNYVNDERTTIIPTSLGGVQLNAGENKIKLVFSRADKNLRFFGLQLYSGIVISDTEATNIYALDYIDADVSLEAPSVQPTNYANYNWNKRGCLDFSKETEQYVTYSIVAKTQGYYFLTGMFGRKDTIIDVYINDTLIHNDVVYKHPNYVNDERTTIIPTALGRVQLNEGENKIKLVFNKVDKNLRLFGLQVCSGIEISDTATTNIYALDYVDADKSLEAPSVAATNAEEYNWTRKGILDFSGAKEQYVTFNVIAKRTGYYSLTGVVTRKPTYVDVYVDGLLIHDDIAYEHPDYNASSDQRTNIVTAELGAIKLNSGKNLIKIAFSEESKNARLFGLQLAPSDTAAFELTNGLTEVTDGTMTANVYMPFTDDGKSAFLAFAIYEIDGDICRLYAVDAKQVTVSKDEPAELVIENITKDLTKTYIYKFMCWDSINSCIPLY